MFRGATLVNLDSKGRITVPARYRSLLAEKSEGQMVCTIDLHQPCLLLYTLPEWELIELKLAQLSTMDPTRAPCSAPVAGPCHGMSDGQCGTSFVSRYTAHMRG